MKSPTRVALLALSFLLSACAESSSDRSPSDATNVLTGAGGADAHGNGTGGTNAPGSGTGGASTPGTDAAVADAHLNGAGGSSAPGSGTGGAAPGSGAGGANTPGTDAAVADAHLNGAGGSSAACAQTSVALRSAAGFVVLAGSTVTSTGATSVTGDLGVSPGTAVTGFGPATLTGTQHAGDPTAAQAEADLTTAYNDAAGRTLCPVAVAGNLGGQTLTPGLYRSTSSLEISSGDLTLDARGDAAAVFIFQMASTLTTSTGRQVILAGGAKSGNVFWQVGSSATIGSTSVFLGNILANQAITLTTGATLNGRALARVAAVTLDANIIVKPAP